jgi:hypothetical protein
MSETPPTHSDQHLADAQPQAINPDVSRERTDANVWAIVTFGISLAGVLIVIHILLLWMFGVLYRTERRDDPGRPAIAADRPGFPEDLKDIEKTAPILQRDDQYDLEKLRRQEDMLLNSEPSWVNQKTKTVRVPIAEAISRLEADPRLAAANGIRFRETPKKDPDGAER